MTLVVIEANFKDMTVSAKVNGNAARADDVDVTELHLLVELEVSEDAEENVEEPFHSSSRY